MTMHEILKNVNGATALHVLNLLLKDKVITEEHVQERLLIIEHGKLTDNTTTNDSNNNNNPTNNNNNNNNNNNTKKKKKKKNKSSKPEKVYRRRPIAIKFYYDGTNYNGLAQNIGKENDTSIERTLFEALCKTQLIESREMSGYSRCGRTDKGVSSAGQVIGLKYIKSSIPIDATLDKDGLQPVLEEHLPKNSVDKIKVWVPQKNNKKNNKADEDDSSTTTSAIVRVEKELTEFSYGRMLNNVLPDVSIRILGWSPVSMDFNARFSATTRTYRYFFLLQPHWKLQQMKQALKLIVGTHDFSNFCKMDVEKVYNFERTIHSAELIIVDDENQLQQNEQNEKDSSNNASPPLVCYFEIMGQAFLWHQIRCIVSILFYIGKGYEEPSIITKLFHDVVGKPSYSLASEYPLVLHQCGYSNLKIGYDVHNLWKVTCELEQEWEEFILKACRIRNCLKMLDDEDIMLSRQDVYNFCKAKLTERYRKNSRYLSSNNDKSSSSLEETLEEMEKVLSSAFSSSGEEKQECLMTSWSNVKSTILKPFGFIPCANYDHSIHIPLMKRGRGTTYDEKVKAILGSNEKRRLRYEENVIKKRKTKEEDDAFYRHMTKQGGSGIEQEQQEQQQGQEH